MMKTLLILALLPSVAFGAAKKWTYPESPKLDDELANVYAGINNVPNGIFKASSMTIQGLTVDSITINSQQSGTSLGRLVKWVVFTDQSQDTTTSATFQSSTLTASITPKSTSSQILVVAATSIRTANGSATEAIASLFRGSTDLGGTSTGLATCDVGSAVAVFCPVTILALDSPSSTASVAYTLKYKNADAATTVQVGRNGQLRTLVLLEFL